MLVILVGGLFLILMLIGLFSAMHGVIRPVVDWMHPPRQVPGAERSESGRGRGKRGMREHSKADNFGPD